MKESYQKIALASLLLARRSVYLSVGLAIIASAGCTGDASKTEVSSASSGFKPADEKSSARSETATSTSNAPGTPALPATPPLA